MVVQDRTTAKRSAMRGLAELGRFARSAGPGAATGVALAVYAPPAVTEAANALLGIAAHDPSIERAQGEIIQSSLSSADQALVGVWSGWIGTTVAVSSVVGAVTSKWKPMRAVIAANAMVGVGMATGGGQWPLWATVASGAAGAAAFGVARWTRGHDEPAGPDLPHVADSTTTGRSRHRGRHRRR